MPTTLICTASPIGLGVMASEIAKNVTSVDSVFIIDYPNYKIPLEFQNVIILNRCSLGEQDVFIPQLKQMSYDVNRKFLFIETSWGLSRHTPKSRNYYIPMWEQPSWQEESKNCDNFISITRLGLRVFAACGIPSRFIPFPIITKPIIEPRKAIITILHNGGSFGGNFRKGTPEAIQIFQKSNLGKEGVKLLVTSLSTPPAELVELANEDPSGIVFDPTMKENWQENYACADLLLFPSRIEGHALAILEAASFGIPALCSNVAPINEYESDSRFLISTLLDHNGRVKADVPEAAEKLRALRNLDWEVKSKLVKKTIQDNYSWDALEKIYDEVLK